MPIARINIVSFSFNDISVLRIVAEGVRAEFGKDTVMVEGHLDLTEFFDPSRGQYKGNELLKCIDDHFSAENRKTIGLFSVDLFIPILTFIYGQAYLGGKSAIASTHRLTNTRYGLPMNPELFRERLIKEVIHELGHTFGLIHCHRPECVMRSSTYVEEIDQKSQHLCGSCRKKLNGK